MSRFAKLTSIDAINRMSAALTAFGEEAAAALEQLDMEAKRALEWIRHDRKSYWVSQVRLNRDRVSESRAELERALTYRGVAGRRPACREERAALEKARRRLNISEEKIGVVRHWTHAIDHEVLELTAAISQLAQWLQAEQPKAQAVLKRLAASLQAYVAAPTATADKPLPAIQTTVERLSKTDTPHQEEDADAENEEPADENQQ